MANFKQGSNTVLKIIQRHQVYLFVESCSDKIRKGFNHSIILLFNILCHFSALNYHSMIFINVSLKHLTLLDISWISWRWIGRWDSIAWLLLPTSKLTASFIWSKWINSIVLQNDSLRQYITRDTLCVELNCSHVLMWHVKSFKGFLVNLFKTGSKWSWFLQILIRGPPSILQIITLI